MFRAVLCFAFVVACLTPAHAVELEGTIKSVDVPSRTLEIIRQTASGDRTHRLEVDKEVGGLSEVKAGEQISISYDPETEVVTKLGAVPQTRPANGAPAEVIALQELDGAGGEDHPWVTSDGLTIYWTTQRSGEKKQIWTASRPKPDLLFENKKQVTIGQDCTFTADGLEGILFLPQEGQGNLCVVKRSAVSNPFSRPSVIQDFPASLGFLAGPSLSDDGRTLYLERLSEEKNELLFSKRLAKDGRWSSPTLLPITASRNRRRWPHVSSSGKYLVCTEPNTEKKGVLTVYRRGAPSEPFSYMGIVRAEGNAVPGRFGRYIEA